MRTSSASSTVTRSTTRTPRRRESPRSSSANSATARSAISSSYSETTSPNSSTTSRLRTTVHSRLRAAGGAKEYDHAMRRALAVIAFLAATVQLHASVLRLNVNDMIHPISDEFIGRALDQAQRDHDDAVIIEITTPGGLLDSTRSIVEKIMTSRVPVIVYVAPAGSRAASAGFFILESADVAAMAPGTNTGAAHPVLLGEKMDEIMKTKMENDAAAFMRTIAAKRTRNVAVAESAVRESKSFTEQEALQQKLIDVIAPDVPSLLRAVDGRTLRRYDGTTSVLHVVGKPVNRYEMTLKERLLSTLMDPNIAFLLFALGGLAIFAELNHPGAVLPGVVGVISILLALFALNLLPTR